MTNSHGPIIIQYVRADPRTRPRCPRPTAVSASEGCVELCCVASPVMEINKIHEESDCRGAIHCALPRPRPLHGILGAMNWALRCGPYRPPNTLSISIT